MEPGTTYIVGAYWAASSNDTRLGMGEGTVFDPRISFIEGRLINSGSLAFPSLTGSPELNGNFKAIPAPNQPPVADAAPDQALYLGDAITLNGSATDPDGDMIVGWQWEIISAPADSNPVLFDATFPNATFTTDVVGYYALTLSAQDFHAWGPPDAVLITVETNQPPTAIAMATPLSGSAPAVPSMHPLALYVRLPGLMVGAGVVARRRRLRRGA